MENEMKVYVLTADTYDENYGSSIELFGVFSTEKKANKRAGEMKLDYPTISVMDIDENEEPSYLGEYIE